LVLKLEFCAGFCYYGLIMKPQAALPLAFLLVLLSGCASQHQSYNQHPPTFSGHPMSAVGAEAEAIWEKQLRAGSHVQNNGVFRAVRNGAAEISLDNGKTWKPVRVGTAFTENSIIRTGHDASADLFIGENGPVVRVTKDTELRVVHLSYRTKGREKIIDTMLELPRGQILGNVKKLAADSSYLVRTHGGIIQIRGTEFSAAANGSISIESGSGVVYSKGQFIQVNPGEKYIPR
jgi:hypothetical protein